MIYKTCTYCGANLDFYEKCDCEDEKVRKMISYEEFLRKHFKKDKNGQISMDE
jgi:hypothetical protein